LEINAIKLGKRRAKVFGRAQDQIQAFQAWEEVSSVSRHCMPGYTHLIPSGSGQKPRTPASLMLKAEGLEYD
jgi:hypothetical protein